MAACPSCGASNPERFRFCGTCGAALPEAEPTGRGQVREVVTVLFVDVTGSTELGEQVDPQGRTWPSSVSRMLLAARAPRLG
jgi:class 3 adenylate cyclase